MKGRKLNWMKAAILESDRVLTVSPYYAQELVTGEERGVELDNVIRSRGITGIVNGMDNREWSPKTDKFIDLHYDATTVSSIFPVIKYGLLIDIELWTIEISACSSKLSLLGHRSKITAERGTSSRGWLAC